MRVRLFSCILDDISGKSGTAEQCFMCVLFRLLILTAYTGKIDRAERHANVVSNFGNCSDQIVLVSCLFFMDFLGEIDNS